MSMAQEQRFKSLHVSQLNMVREVVTAKWGNVCPRPQMISNDDLGFSVDRS